jgi:hypothetical protein
MNFLSHYFIHRHLANPYFTLGKILPDMLRHLGPSTKIREAQNVADPKNGTGWLEKGVHLHLATDRIFHQSQYFEEMSNFLKKVLKEDQIFKKFRYIYAHILLELLLDRVLIANYREAALRFYDQLMATEKATIAAYFRYKGLTLDNHRFFQHLQRFVHSRYLFNYLENEGLVFALERTTHLAGLPLFAKSDKSKLINKIEWLEATVEADYLSIFKKLEKEIPE